MASINEQEVFVQFLGERVNMINLQAIAREKGSGYGVYADSKRYLITHTVFYEKSEYQKLFKLTSALTDRWDYKGIEFNLYLYVRDGIVTGGYLEKYVDTTMSSHFRPTGYVTDATQQELRVAMRILSFLTAGE